MSLLWLLWFVSQQRLTLDKTLRCILREVLGYKPAIWVCRLWDLHSSLKSALLLRRALKAPDSTITLVEGTADIAGCTEKRAVLSFYWGRVGFKNVEPI